MTLESLFLFNLTLIAAMSSPGPAMILAIKTNVSQGFSQGLYLGVGLGLGATLWTVFALFGLDILFKLFPWLYTTLKIAAAFYLLYLAVRMWQYATLPVGSSEKPKSALFWQGTLVNLMNPKAILFAGSTLLVLFPSYLSFAERLFIGANQLFAECLFYIILGLILRTKAIGHHYLRQKIYFDRFAACLLGALGIRLFLEFNPFV